MKKGFTLLELIIVIIILGILATIGVSQYQGTIEKGREAEARSILGSMRTAMVAELVVVFLILFGIVFCGWQFMDAAAYSEAKDARYMAIIKDLHRQLDSCYVGEKTKEKVHYWYEDEEGELVEEKR